MIQTLNDRINWTSDLPGLRRGALLVLDALQGERTQVQYFAPIVSFAAMAETLNRNPHDDVARVRRMMSDLQGPFAEQVRAIRDYARGELAGGVR